MKIYTWQDMDETQRRIVLSRPACDQDAGVADAVKDILLEVRRDGDAAVRRFTEKFDKARLDTFAIDRDTLKAAYDDISEEGRSAIMDAYKNIKFFHENQG